MDLKIKEALAGLAAPVINVVVKMVFKPLLNGLVKAQPVHGKVAIAAMYPIVDAELEPLVNGTDNAIDNSTIAAIKDVLEDVAKENNIDLSNVDAD